MVAGMVFDIKRYSIHDGPGIRTTVFFKGCHLHCSWCHNPEGRSFDPELMIWPERCIGCKTCVSVCPNSAVSTANGLIVTDRGKCKACGVCAEKCPANAREIIGKKFSVDELMREVEKDVPFYEESGGGVTISGGEPLAQPRFLNAFSSACKKKGIHVALDTNGYAKTEIVTKAGRNVDLFLYDLKMMDDKKHKLHTGVSNELILKNLKRLDSLGKKIIVRFPLIPGVNSDEENVHSMIDFLSKLRNVKEIDILPYHKLGIGKAKRLGKKAKSFEKPSDEMVENIAKEFKSSGFKVKIGG
jgi:pyruvate formate lyase activating enzyme